MAWKESEIPGNVAFCAYKERTVRVLMLCLGALWVAGCAVPQGAVTPDLGSKAAPRVEQSTEPKRPTAVRPMKVVKPKTEVWI